MSAKYDARVAGALAAATPNLDGVEGYPIAHAWLHTGQGDLAKVSEELAMSAIEAAVRLRKIDRLNALETGPKHLRKAGRAGLHRLKAAGVAVEAPRPSASFSLSREVVNVPPRALMSVPDINGLSQIAMAFTDAQGTCAVFGLFGGDEGVRRLEHAHISRGGARRFFEDILAMHGIVEVPFTHALHHALKGVDTASAKGPVPHDWEHFAEHLTADHLAAARAYSPLGDLPAEAEEGRLEATESLDVLFGGVPWAVSPAAFHALEAELKSMELAGQVAEAINQGEEPQIDEAAAPAEDAGDAPPSGGADFDAALRVASAKAIDDDDVRQDWQDRLEIFATLFREKGQEDTLVEMRHLAAALRDRVPGERIGLCRSMLRLALFASASEVGFGQEDSFEEVE